MINTVNDYTYNQLGNMAKTNASTPRTNVSRLNHEEIESVHIQIMSNVTEHQRDVQRQIMNHIEHLKK